MRISGFVSLLCWLRSCPDESVSCLWGACAPKRAYSGGESPRADQGAGMSREVEKIVKDRLNGAEVDGVSMAKFWSPLVANESPHPRVVELVLRRASS